tara:strand:+ start:588 stop:875 length:288 start_codon:yes stop_codon:yes gene_type:complete
MANKRLSIDIDESLHAQLKAEASAQGLHLGPYCEAILEARGDAPSSVEKLDATTISTMPLDALRTMCSELAENKPRDWEKGIRLVNTEIRRRYRV